MATQEMNADKENPDDRKMEVEEGVEPAEKDKGRFSVCVCVCVCVCVGGGQYNAGLLFVPNKKIHSSSYVYLSPRQRTQRP